jgi:hydroxymethylglutaryl-CoA reductase (NADPH)
MIAIAVFLMFVTLLNLALNMRRLGSKFSLTFSVFLSSGVAFLAALALNQVMGLSIDMIELIEAIPFFVVAIGFDKPIRLTEAVFEAAKVEKGSIRERVLIGSSKSAPVILYDYFIEIGILFLGGYSGTRISRFCVLSGFILLFDLLLLFSFYLAILVLKLEVCRS